MCWAGATRAKIAALEAKRGRLEKQLGDVASKISVIQKQRDTLTSSLDALSRLEEFTDFDELDWASVAAEIAQLPTNVVGWNRRPISSNN